jgi:hypothetical protein
MLAYGLILCLLCIVGLSKMLLIAKNASAQGC